MCMPRAYAQAPIKACILCSLNAAAAKEDNLIYRFPSSYLFLF